MKRKPLSNDHRLVWKKPQSQFKGPLPVHDQGSKNSCTAHSFALMLELQLSRHLGDVVHIDVDDLWDKQKIFGTATEEKGDVMEGPFIIAEEYGVRFKTNGGMSGLFYPSRGIVYDNKRFMNKKNKTNIVFDNYTLAASEYFRRHFPNFYFSESRNDFKEFSIVLSQPSQEFYHQKKEDLRAGMASGSTGSNIFEWYEILINIFKVLTLLLPILIGRLYVFMAKRSRRIKVTIENPLDDEYIKTVNLPEDQILLNKVEVIFMINKINKETLIKFSAFIKSVFENTRESLLPLFIGDSNSGKLEVYYNRKNKDWDILR